MIGEQQAPPSGPVGGRRCGRRAPRRCAARCSGPGPVPVGLVLANGREQPVGACPAAMPGAGVRDAQRGCRPSAPRSSVDVQPPAAGMASRALRNRLTSTVQSWPAVDVRRQPDPSGTSHVELDLLLPAPGADQVDRPAATTSRRSHGGAAAAAGGRAKSRKPWTVCSRRAISPWMTRRFSARQRLAASAAAGPPRPAS